MPDDAFSPLLQTNDWLLYSQGRARQRLTGLVGAILLVLTFAVLADGLVARMFGGGSYRLEMLPGTSEPVSGPLGMAQHPEDRDMAAYPSPPDAPIEFEFGGFFASYWFGTGMWRGTVHVRENAESGTYYLDVGVAGQAYTAFQTYTIAVASSVEEQNQLSLSAIRRWTGWNPFYLAVLFGTIGIGCAIGSFCLGARANRLMREMGLAEVFKVESDGELLRLHVVVGKREVKGKSFVCFDADLRRLGKVIIDTEKGGLMQCLFVKGERGDPAKGSLIAFWEPTVPEFKPMRRGLFSEAITKAMKKTGTNQCDASPGTKADATRAAQETCSSTETAVTDAARPAGTKAEDN